ncbi:hypothetical protein [Nonomuraea sp. NPDC050643]|uniref:hypothetical protein n=1 Tax=Nonomuraea sp. NPDC050643 TaxID=3155660 RepID=UPI003406169F
MAWTSRPAGDLAFGEPVGVPRTGRTDRVWAMATAVVDDRPVAIFAGGDNGIVRVCDLVSGQRVGEPFRGHTDWVTAIATAVVEGRPVALSGSDDHTIRMWDLSSERRADETAGRQGVGRVHREAGR